MKEKYNPPFSITNKIIDMVSEISELIGYINVTAKLSDNPQLRRVNRIKTIQASLAIENNTLSVEQITALLDGKRVLGKPVEIKEAKNAYNAYENLLTYNPYKIKDLLKAHGVLMAGLTEQVGMFRTGGVGVVKGTKVIHMAPSAKMVLKLMQNLLEWYKASDVHPLIKSSVFHYELEFIHPFSDGNGRMGRLWHTLLLTKWQDVLAWVPVETLVKKRQDEYYSSLENSDKQGECTSFIEFMLIAMRDTLLKLNENDQVSDQVSDQVKKLLQVLGSKTLSASELMQLLNLKHKPTFRKNYLNPALEQGLIEMTIPDKPSSRNQKYRFKKRFLVANPDVG